MYAAEKGIALEIVDVDLAGGGAQSPEYLAVNPLGDVPTLQRDDGSYLAESLAICRWLEEAHPEPRLFGHTALERAGINEWIDRLMFRLYVPSTHVFRHTHAYWATRLRQVPEWGELQRTAVLSEYDALDQHLVGREYLAGDAFSMADIVGFTTVDFGKPSGLRPGAERPHLSRWYEAMRARPSARA
jgi:glutathione S-transferase